MHDIAFAVGIAACQQLTGINAIIAYAPGIFEQAGSSSPTVSACSKSALLPFTSASPAGQCGSPKCHQCVEHPHVGLGG